MRRIFLGLMSAVTVGVVGCSSEDGKSGVLPGTQSMLFVKRAFIEESGEHNVTGGSNQTIDYLRYVPGGGVFVLTPPTPTGELRELTKDFEGVDINGIDLSFDAKQVVFSMRHQGSSHYQIYIANLDGTDLRQLTFGDYDDVKPIWVPGDRIAFATNQPYTAMGTRADEYNHSRVVSQIATISVASGDADRRVCSQNLSHSADPFMLSDGRIGFSRWEHLGPVNDVKLFAMNPDCTQIVALAGQHGKPGNSLVQMSEVEPGVLVGIVTSRERTIQSGALVQVDYRSRSGNPAIPFDEQRAKIDVLTPSVPTGEGSPPSKAGRYRFPHAIPGSKDLLVSWSDGDVNDRNELAGVAPKFGIYLWNTSNRDLTLIYDDKDTWDLYATPVAERDVPPVNPGVVGPAPDQNLPATIGSINLKDTMHNTSLTESVQTLSNGHLDGVALNQALVHANRVRIIEGFSSEIGSMGMGQFGLTMHEGAAVIGEAQVRPDGSWLAQVPAYLPYHLQPLDEYGMSIRNQLLWVQAMPGEQRLCGGCHEGRTDSVKPQSGTTTLAQQMGPENFVKTIPNRMELPWYGATTHAPGQPYANVQDLLNAKCASCHTGGPTYTVNVETEAGEMLAFQIPYFDLSDRPVMTYYENEVVTYPASYVSLMTPGSMMGDSMATGNTPPIWVVPGAARESEIIHKMNVPSEDGSSWAWSHPSHPEDVGAPALTREERMMLVRMADLGGQYYSRRNVEGAAQWQTTQY